VVATKGAPEAIFDLCHLDVATLARWRERVTAMAKGGLRVLAVARSAAAVDAPPAHPHDVPFALVGLVGLEDPLRDDVPAAIADCQRAGVRVMMITGDHPDTARAIARAAGIAGQRLLTGAEIDALDDAALDAALAETSVIARAVPAHKLRIVQALQARGRVIGMTGDGVNDAPALKRADIGIAMGLRGTDVAREAAALVLVGDDFGAIATAVRMGRRIHDNLKKAVHYLMAVHVPIAGLALVPALLGWDLVLAPVHVIFLEIIIDPACSVVFEMEPDEPDVMRRPPRALGARLVTARGLGWALGRGALALAGVLGLVLVMRGQGHDPVLVRTLAFVALVGGNLALLLASRSLYTPLLASFRRRNRSVAVLVGLTLATLALLLLVPTLRELFGFVPVGGAEALVALAAGALPVLLLALLPRRAIPARAMQ
jgi:Ca2+-transporting ATPase